MLGKCEIMKQAGGTVVWFPDWHECQSGERTPPERGILLQRTLALKILLAPPHVSYRIGFCSTWTRPGQWRNLLQSFLFEARADLAAPPVCPLAHLQFVHWISSILLTRICGQESSCICYSKISDLSWKGCCTQANISISILSWTDKTTILFKTNSWWHTCYCGAKLGLFKE